MNSQIQPAARFVVAIAAALLALGGTADPARALDKCKAKIDPKDGAIQVSAKGVTRHPQRHQRPGLGRDLLIRVRAGSVSPCAMPIRCGAGSGGPRVDQPQVERAAQPA